MFESDEEKLNKRKGKILLKKYIQKIRPIIERQCKWELCLKET